MHTCNPHVTGIPHFHRLVAYTGPDAEAPAFDGKAYVVLNGTWGSTGEEELVNDSFSYAPGVPQTFTIEASDVGSLQTISARIVASGTVST